MTLRMTPQEIARWKAAHELTAAGPDDPEFMPPPVSAEQTAQECGALLAQAQAPTVDEWRKDAEQLAQALGAIEASNGYGLDVPSWYGASREWLVKSDAIKLCKVALDAHKKLTEAHDANGS